MIHRPLSPVRSALLRGASLIALAAGGALLASPARADAPAYQGPVTNGNWSNILNWSTASAPNSGSATTVNNGKVVSTDGNNSTNTLTVGPTAGSGVTISDNTVLNIGGAVVNQGVITLNSVGDGTDLRTLAGGTITLSGGGTLQLSNSGNNFIRDTANGTGSLVNVDNLIQGAGNIGVGALSLDNQKNGVVNANVSTTLFLQSNGTGSTNEGLMKASAGGTLNINGSTLTQSGGTLLATGAGSSVLLTNTTVSGGTLTTAAGGTIASAGGGATLSNVTISTGSTVTGTDNTSTTLVGTITNKGTLLLNSVGDGTEFRTQGGATVTLTGGGVLQMSNRASNFIRDAANGTGTLVNVDNTIQGSGNIGNGQLSLTNQAGGTVTANQSTALYIQANSAGVSNAGLLQANGGTLNIYGSSVTQTGSGTILGTNNSTVVLLNTSIIGGTLTTTGGGAIVTGGNGATLTNVTISTGSTVTTTDNTATTLVGTIVNNGTLLLNSVGDTTELRTQGGATVTLTGGGTVQLSNSNSNLIRDAANSTGTLVNVNNTIQGTGNVGVGQLQIDNQAAGVIDANRAATTLTLQANSGGVSNEGTLRATAGTLNILNTSVTQTGAGTIAANGGTVQLQNSSVTGGTLSSTNGGTLTSTGTNNLTNLTITAGSTYNLADNSATYINGTITNNGTIAINSGGNGTELRVAPATTTTLTGGGTVTMTGVAIIRDYNNSTGTLVNVNNTIQGAGSIGANGLGIDNQAAGTIVANTNGATLTLQTNSQGLSNEGALRATNGGTLNIVSTAVTQSATGTILASGGTVQLQNSSVTGGTIGNTSTGTLTSIGTNNLTNLTITAGSTYNIADNSATYINGTITNNGTIAVNSGGNGTELRITPGGTTTLAGGGTVQLSNTGTNIIRDYNSSTGVLVNVDNTIQGSGQVGANGMAIVNRVGGTINANFNGGTIILQGNAYDPNATGPTAVSNAGNLVASNGGTLDIRGTVNQTGTGVTTAATGSTVIVDGATISGGTLTTTGTGTMRTSGTSTLTGVTISTGSTVTATDNTTTYLNGTITNRGTISLASGGNTTELRITPGGTTTLAGGGVVNVGASGSNLIRDYNSSTGTLVNQDNTIQGGGQVGAGATTIVNQSAGTISANLNGVTMQLSTNGGGLTNQGTLLATNGGTLNVTGGPLHNYSGGTLTGGTYHADAGSTINLNTAGIVTNAATIVLNGTGSAINTQAGAVETTLTTNNGTLQVLGNRNYSTANAIGNSGTLQLGGGTFASNGLTNAAAGTVTGFGTVAPTNGAPLANAGTVVATGGTLVLATGISGAGTLTVASGATASFAGAPTSNTVGTLNQNGTLATAGKNVTVSSDYTNANFGTGNAFNKNANVTGGGQILASGNTAQAVTGANIVNGTTSSPTLSLGQFHTSDAAHPTGGASATFNIANTGTTGPALRGAIQTTGITSASLSGSGVTATNFGPIATGSSSGPYTVTVAPGAAGQLTGQTIHIANNFANVAEQTIAVTGTGYNYAQATINTAAPVNFGNVHVNAAATAALNIGNTAPAGAYTENLNGAAGTTTGAATVTGSFNALAAGSTSNAVTVGLDTSTAGAKSGTATVNFVSNAAGVNTLGNTTLASQAVGVSGNVYNLASSNTLAAVNFGVLHTGSGTQTRTISVTNTAPTGAFSEGLNSTFGAYTNTGTVGVTASGSVINLAAGATNNTGLVLSVSTAQAGTVQGTIQVNQASNGTISGLANTSLGSQNPAVSGTVQATVTNLAVGQVNTAQPVAFGNVRVGSTATSTLSITNAAPASQYSENLIANSTGNGAGTTGGVTLTGGFGGTNTASSLAAQSTDTTHVTVGINTATAGAKSGNAVINFQSDGTAFNGGGITDLGTQNVAVTGNVYRTASPTLNTTALTLAARVGGTASGTISITNTSPDIYTEGLKATSSAAPSGFTATGSVANLAAGGTDASSLRVALNTGTAGTFTGTQTTAFTSTGAGTTGAADLSVGSGNTTLTGKVYAAAVASVTPSPVNFGTVHVNDVVAPRSLTVGNTATGALTDSLKGGFGTVTGPFSGSGTLGNGVAAGSNSTALSVGLNTSTAGVYSGTAGLSLVSHDGDLADASVSVGPVSLSGTVNNYAVSGFGQGSGAGTFSGATNSYTLDFGTVAQGASVFDSLFADNLAIGPADLLSGAYSVQSGSGFSFTGLNAFSGLGAGQNTGAIGVTFNTGAGGRFVEVIDLKGTGSNDSGYSGVVTDTFLTIEGTVQGSGPTPVPEPGALALLATGVAAVLGLRRRYPRVA